VTKCRLHSFQDSASLHAIFILYLRNEVLAMLCLRFFQRRPRRMKPFIGNVVTYQTTLRYVLEDYTVQIAFEFLNISDTKVLDVGSHFYNAFV
jgi:hypothetical protein